MVEIRVAVTDVTHVHGLMRRLESRSVVEVIDAVRWWLPADGLGSAKLSVGDRSYTLVAPTASAAQQGRTA